MRFIRIFKYWKESLIEKYLKKNKYTYPRNTTGKIEQWKSLYEKYKSILKVNSKSVLEIIEFLKRKYVIVEETSEEFKHVVINNIKLNKPFHKKISSDKELKPIVFTIPNEGNAKIVRYSRGNL